MIDLKKHRGFTLMELLVVVAIIVMITSVAVPIMMRGGFFSGNKTGAAAADLFAQLRAAKIHATTKNVDTAIAYGVALRDGVLVYDSLYDPVTSAKIDELPQEYIDNYPNATSPINLANPLGVSNDPQAAVLGFTIMVRRITVNELKEVGDTNNISLAGAIIAEFKATEFVYGLNGTITFDYDLTKNVFVPIEGNSGHFQPLPNDTCVLINQPEMMEDNTPDILTNLEEETALQGIYIIQVERDGAGDFVVNRVLPTRNNTDTVVSPPAPDVDLTFGKFPKRGFPDTLDVVWKNQFPAHIFNKSGGLDVPSQFPKQRFRIAVGLYPDERYYDRYLMDDELGRLLMEDDVYTDGSHKLYPLDTDLEFYVATGRVKVVKDVQ